MPSACFRKIKVLALNIAFHAREHPEISGNGPVKFA
ncbi:hypothetical protein AWB69_04955 [Caballeronia udeis]|uniref:Uncharacterized protein n=1 Tax=Caballeronia udeis TaxID=1232866 RepID=A0A158HY55_9BURK|nr:hypothetical protein AWB69_04955 [Caballeronia udeis]